MEKVPIGDLHHLTRPFVLHHTFALLQRKSAKFCQSCVCFFCFSLIRSEIDKPLGFDRDFDILNRLK